MGGRGKGSTPALTLLLFTCCTQAMRCRPIMLAYARNLYGKATRLVALSDQQQATRISRMALGDVPVSCSRRLQEQYPARAETLRHQLWEVLGADLPTLKMLSDEMEASVLHAQRAEERMLLSARAEDIKARQHVAVAAHVKHAGGNAVGARSGAGAKRMNTSSAIAVPAASVPAAAAAAAVAAAVVTSAPAAAVVRSAPAAGESTLHIILRPRPRRLIVATASMAAAIPENAAAAIKRAADEVADLAHRLQERAEGCSEEAAMGGGSDGGSGGFGFSAQHASEKLGGDAARSTLLCEDAAAPCRIAVLRPSRRRAAAPAPLAHGAPQGAASRALPLPPPSTEPAPAASAREESLRALMLAMVSAMDCGSSEKQAANLAWLGRTAAARLENENNPGRRHRLHETLPDVQIIDEDLLTGLTVLAPGLRTVFEITSSTTMLTPREAAVLVHAVMARWNGTGAQLQPVEAGANGKGKMLSMGGSMPRRWSSFHFYATR